MVQPLISDSNAMATNPTTFKVSMTELELQFMTFQMEASIDACKKMGRQPGDPIEEDPHFQGLKRILTKFRNAMVIGNKR